VFAPVSLIAEARRLRRELPHNIPPGAALRRVTQPTTLEKVERTEDERLVATRFLGVARAAAQIRSGQSFRMLRGRRRC
jgi:hypothetical protein